MTGLKARHFCKENKKLEKGLILKNVHATFNLADKHQLMKGGLLAQVVRAHP